MTPAAVALILAAAFADVHHARPSPSTLRLAVAQVRLEGLALPGRNLGGLMVRGRRRQRLAAFASYREAARAYWRTIARCKAALPWFERGDVDGAAAALRACHYFAAPLNVYAGRWVTLAR